MATLNYAFKEISCKIVYYGCGLCGKTTNLIHVHKTVPGKFRGELVSLATEQDRTLFFDFLPLDLGEVKGFKTKFQLYTVPGQVYYNATRKLVLRGVDGLVFVIDSQKDRLQENVESFENLKQNLAEYGYHLQEGPDDEDGIPWVLQLNKRDMPQISPTEEITEALSISGHSIPVYESVAVTGGGVKETLKGISSLVIQKLNTGGTAPAATPAKPGAAPAAPQPVGAGASTDDEYGAVSEDELSDEALERQPQPPAAPAAPQQPVAAAPQQTPAAVAPAASAGDAPTLNVTQACVGKWRGMKSGSGQLTFTNINGTSEYQITGFISFAIFFKRSFSKRLVWKGAEQKTYDGSTLEFHRFESVAGDEDPQINVWVSNDDSKNMFASYNGFGGEINLLPPDKKKMP